MPKGEVKLTEKDMRRELRRSMDRLANTVVLVGIPASKAARKSEDTHGAPSFITNCELGYIHEFGAPEAGIPPRPFLIPGVTKAREKFLPYAKAAGEYAIRRDWEKATQMLTIVGQIAAQSAQLTIRAGLSPALSPHYRRARDHGLDAAGLAARKPLIDTGALLQSITFIVTKTKDAGQ